jgi:hypothetical protein
MTDERIQRIAVNPGYMDYMQFKLQENLAATQTWVQKAPNAQLPTVAELLSYPTAPTSTVRSLESILGLPEAHVVQSSLEVILNAAEADTPAAVQLLLSPDPPKRLHGPVKPTQGPFQPVSGGGGGFWPVPENITTAIDSGLESVLTGGQFLELIKSGRYPWWWGPMRGLKDVSYMLTLELREFQKSSWLPQVTKELATTNISAAMSYVREQRARGGEKIAL